MKTPSDDTRTFANLLRPSNIVCNSASRTPLDIVDELLAHLVAGGDISDVEPARTAIEARLGEPGISLGHRIALPHARLPGLQRLLIALATSSDGIPFNHDTQETSQVIFLVLTPKDNPAVYLETLSSISRLRAAGDLVGELLACKTPEDVLRYFQSGSCNLPRYVCAGDIMESNTDVLQDTDTLAKAIDLFTRGNRANVPVVDRDGELVGVVTAYELLRVCLPDYILWMDDVSPIINFEPFAEVLRHETDTWLAEIMSTDYAVVAEDAPAIEVAKEIAKHKTRSAFVVRGKKLVGIIRLPRFLNAIFRE